MPHRVNYFATVYTALKITWHHKYLWFLGIFGAGLALGNNFAGDLDWDWSLVFSPKSWTVLSTRISDLFWIYPARMTAISAGLLAIIIFFVVFGVFGQSALVYAIDQISQKRKTTLRGSLTATRKFFWKIFALDACFAGVTTLVVLIFCLVPLFLWFEQNKRILAVGLGIVGFMIACLALLLALIILRYGAIFIVLKRQSLRQALQSAFRLFKAHPWETILMIFFLWANQVILSLGIVLFSLLLLVPFGLIVIILGLILNKTNVQLIMITASALSLLITLLVSSFISAFKSAVWTLTFKQLTSRFKLS